MKDIFLVSIIIILVLYIISTELRIKRGKIKPVDTYSYKPVIRRTLLHVCIAAIICLLIYLFSKSAEVTISLSVFFLLCIVGGLLFGLLLEYQTKRRGGRKLE